MLNRKIFCVTASAIFLANSIATIGILAKYSEPETSKTSETRISAPEGSDCYAPIRRSSNSEPLAAEIAQTDDMQTSDEEEKVFDVPLSEELQEFIQERCEEYSLPCSLVYAVIERESSYRADVVSKTSDYGLMQINAINHETLSETLGLTDFLDPEQNVTAGIYMLGNYWEKYGGNARKALMAYNLGETGAKRRWNNGEYTTSYAESILEIQNRIEKCGK